MIIDIVSDLHGEFPVLQGGDLLIVAGDLTARDSYQELDYFEKWLCVQAYKKKIVIAGNHDTHIERNPKWMGSAEYTYLCDSGTEFEGLKIWGSPWTKYFHGMNPKCTAFVVETDAELASKWAKIPDDTDILITHCPAWGFGDEVERDHMDVTGTVHEWCEHTGSKSLLHWVADHALTLKMHVCGHIHEGYGIYDVRKQQKALGSAPSPILVNASHVDKHYKPVNKPVRVIL